MYRALLNVYDGLTFPIFHWHHDTQPNDIQYNYYNATLTIIAVL